MKRRTFLVCSAALFCGALLAGGCTPKTSQPVLQQIEYSNLADSDTQALLSKLLQDAGVSDLRIRTFFDHVQKFNNAVDPAWLTTGFENAKPSDLKYDPYSMQVEKVAFQEPYRLLKFKNRTELSDYLMLKYDNSWGQDTAHTFIMENSDLMDGWRILDTAD